MPEPPLTLLRRARRADSESAHKTSCSLSGVIDIKVFTALFSGFRRRRRWTFRKTIQYGITFRKTMVWGRGPFSTPGVFRTEDSPCQESSINGVGKVSSIPNCLCIRSYLLYTAVLRLQESSACKTLPCRRLFSADDSNPGKSKI